jgi:hypothetical protein
VHITGDTALRLAHFFGTSGEFWLNLQSLYELRLAQQKAGELIKDLPTLKHSKSHRRVRFATASRSIINGVVSLLTTEVNKKGLGTLLIAG